MQTRFNQRLTTTDMRVLNDPLGELFDEQTTAFKVNLGYGFILMEKQSGRFKYYHSSCNCCGRYLEEPALITNRADFVIDFSKESTSLISCNGQLLRDRTRTGSVYL